MLIWVFPTVTFPIGDNVNVFNDYKKMFQSQILKLLSCRFCHLIDMFVEVYKNHIFLTLLKRAISVNIYQFLHNLLRTLPLWRKNCQKSFRLFKSSKNLGLHCKTCSTSKLAKVSTQMQLHQMIFQKLHLSKITVPYIRALHTQGNLSEARSQIGKRLSEKVSNFISCCGTIYMSTHYGKLLLVTSLLFLSQPNQNSALPIIIAENQSHNLITGQILYLINHRPCTLDFLSIANQRNIYTLCLNIPTIYFQININIIA